MIAHREPMLRADLRIKEAFTQTENARSDKKRAAIGGHFSSAGRRCVASRMMPPARLKGTGVGGAVGSHGKTDAANKPGEATRRDVCDWQADPSGRRADCRLLSFAPRPSSLGQAWRTVLLTSATFDGNR